MTEERESRSYDVPDCVKDLRVDRCVLSDDRLPDEGDGKVYYRMLTPSERLAYLELLRQQTYGYDPEKDRMDKSFFEVVELSDL